MTNDEITRLLRMAIVMLENMSKEIMETEDVKDINELMERLQKLLREGSNDELR